MSGNGEQAKIDKLTAQLKLAELLTSNLRYSQDLGQPLSGQVNLTTKGHVYLHLYAIGDGRRFFSKGIQTSASARYEAGLDSVCRIPSGFANRTSGRRTRFYYWNNPTLISGVVLLGFRAIFNTPDPVICNWSVTMFPQIRVPFVVPPGIWKMVA